MSIFRINKDNYENFEIAVSPKRYFSSSSTNGVTGSIILSLGEVTQSSFVNSNQSLEDTALNRYNTEIDIAKSELKPPNSKTNIFTNINNLLTKNNNNITLEQEQKEKQIKLSIQRFSGWLPHGTIASQSVGIKNYCINS